MKFDSICHWRLLGFLLATLSGFGETSGQPYEWTTLAGSNGGVGFRDGPLGTASFKNPIAVATDAAGNIYLADTGNHTIRKISVSGMVTTLAGKGGIAGNRDGSGDQARFNNPGGIAFDAVGDLFVADTANHTIRKISPAGLVSTLAGEAGVPGHSDGIAGVAHFSSPTAITLAPDGNLFVADTGNHLIRKITPDGLVSTFAGTAETPGASDGGPGVARFNAPKALATDDTGMLFIADSGNHLIRTISPAGIVTTLAGVVGSDDNVDGIGSAARFYDPEGIVVDSAHNIYVADPVAGTIRRISATDGMVTTLAGDINAYHPGMIDGIGTATLFNEPRGLVLANDGNVLVADTGNHALRQVTPAGVVTTVALNPPSEYGAVDAMGLKARFRSPYGLAVAGDGMLLIADTGNLTIRQISSAGAVSTFAGTTGLSGNTDATGAGARFTSPRAVTLGPGGIAYVADVVSNYDSTIRKITPGAAVTTLAGAPGTLALADKLFLLSGVVADPSGNIFASDYTSIRKITPQGVASVFAGYKRGVMVIPGGGSSLFWRYESQVDGIGTSAYFNYPSGVAIDSNRNLFVTEYSGCIIRKVTPAGQATTLAGQLNGNNAIPGATDGTGSAARFKNPHGIAVDASGTLYIADSGNHTIRMISPAGVVTTIGGLPGYAGSGEGVGDRALFYQPYGIAVDSSGTIYVADTHNQRIVKGIALAPDLTISLTATPQPVPSNGNLTYTIEVTNSGTLEATGVNVSDILPPSLAFVSAVTPNGWSSSLPAVGSSGLVAFNKNLALAIGDSATITIIAMVKDTMVNGTIIHDRAVVSTTGPETKLANNIAATSNAVGTTNPTPVQLTTTGTLNPQTGLFQFTVNVTNTTPLPINGFRLHIDYRAYQGAYPSLRLYNASSPPSGNDVFVDYPYPVAVDDTVPVELAFYTSSRTFPDPFAPILTVESLATSAVSNTNGSGVHPNFTKLANGTVLIEFPAVIGKWYRIRYSPDLVNWSDCPVPIQAGGTSVQWIDSGAPLTNLSPADPAVTSRFYLVNEINILE